MAEQNDQLAMSVEEATLDAAVCCPGIEDQFDPRFFKALGDPNRIAILVQLARCMRPCTVTELADCCPVDFSVVSRHLVILRDAGIVEAEKQGKQVYYSARLIDIAGRMSQIADSLTQAAFVRSKVCC
ncbi:metalloregulator ArsR/SmtB family transcription factor [bacterium]|nr:metalloregulator ArsR/SmtB family transcription factor [bacterium]